MRGGTREAQRALAQVVTDAELGLSARTSATAAELLERWFEFAKSEHERLRACEHRRDALGRAAHGE